MACLVGVSDDSRCADGPCEQKEKAEALPLAIYCHCAAGACCTPHTRLRVPVLHSQYQYGSRYNAISSPLGRSSIQVVHTVLPKSLCSRAAVIVLWDKRHLGESDGLLLLAQHHVQLSAHLGEVLRHVCHADATLKDRRMRTARDDADLLVIRVQDLGALARRSALDCETDALARIRLAGDLTKDALGSDEGARRPALLVHNPQQ
mmetsp:Transcript_26140/g.66363  ORF Transcript_26140/g.66363 Transcript_26140/m.66363 type:complete len:205 (-) Transcript_26140:908-1522(-)